ncbi:hypothetical protein DPMN_044432 [Dreissena polymorpha]|uniref:Uncharacterized protein n=1 Tax=Dreissena polymorpha TaxID=45954 RepID=A0A9D4D2Y3_DREPO|nr:hypothetical protein DPMN_044432 [Dreissena polymorpha]
MDSSASTLTSTNPKGSLQLSTDKLGVYQTKEDNAGLLGPIIGGTCAILVITIAVIGIVVVIRRRKRDSPTPAPKDEDIITENPIYDTDDTRHNGTITQNDDTNDAAAHYSTISSSDETVDVHGGSHTKREHTQQDYYSKVDKSSKQCKGNTRRNTPHNIEYTDEYDSTDVKREVTPFNEYNHLSTVHKNIHRTHLVTTT